ncbi:endonuclease domain-containing protein [Microbacterium sp. GXF7504]
MVDTDAAAVLAAVGAAGGVARGTEIVAQGHRHRTIAALVSAGLLLRVRRVWLALPGADPLALAAAREGVVVSCVTQARRLGLWVLDDGPPHVAADPHGASVTAPGAVVHWARPLLPRPRSMLFDTVENALALLVGCRAEEEARAAVESALNRGLVEREELLRMALSARMRRFVEEAEPWADSGLETIVRTRLRWLGLPIVSQAWILGHRVDFLIGERLVLQIDGGHHVGPQRDADNAHDALLMLHGYHVIGVGYRQVVEGWPQVQDRIMRAVAQGLHRAR